MAVKTIQLPENLNPKEEELNIEDTKIIAAFRIVFDGYRRAQSRTRAVIKAYNDLESIALTLLKERQENCAESPKQKKPNPGELSPGLGEEDELDVMFVDLTSDFDFERAEIENRSLRSPSLLFGAHAKPTKNGKSLDDASTSRVEGIDVRPQKSTKFPVVNNQDRTSTENEKKTDGNEQKGPLVGNTSVKNALGGSAGESSHLHSNAPKPRPKLSLNRTAYKIEKHKTTSGKPLKQSTLVFESPAVKMDISYSENTKPKPNVSSHSPNVFDADYRVNKIPNKKDQAVKGGNKDLLELDEKNKLDEPASRSVSKVLGEQAAIQNDENSDELVNKFIVMETPSQIDESCRSLFADDDLEDFTVSEDLLNTCMDEPVAIDIAQSKTPKNVGKRRKIDETIASPPKATQHFNNCDSIDETFFAPGEPLEKNNVDVKPIEKPMPLAGCSSFLTPKNAADKSHNLKRKSVGVVAANDELEDLNLIDSDWDSDTSIDNWSTPKPVLNNSYDIVPRKANKSPNYAYLAKPERNKEKRSKLPGWDCWECEKYFSALNLPKAELQKRMNACSRHKAKYNPRYCTPKDFWNPDFPDTLDSSDWSDNEVKKG